MSTRTRCGVRGFTLIELILVIVILGILSAVAIPRLFDFSADARKSSTLGILGGVRSAISLYFTKSALPPPVGASRVWYPTLVQMQGSDGGPGAVMESKMADNPYSTNATVDNRNNVAGVVMTSGGVRPSGAGVGTVNAWAYDESGGGLSGAGMPYATPNLGSDVGTFWPNTSTSGVNETFF